MIAMSLRLPVSVLVFAVLATALLLPAVAPPPAEAASVSQQLELTRQRIAAAQRREGKLDRQLGSLDDKLSRIDDELARLHDQIASVEERLRVTRAKLELVREQLRLKRRELAEAQEELELQQRAFSQRVVLTYKSTELDYVDVLFAAESFEELVTRLRLVRELVGYDNELVADLESARDKVDAEEQAIAEKESVVAEATAELQEENDRLAALRAAQQAQQQAALAARADKRDALQGVAANLAELERQEDALLAQSRAISGAVAGSAGAGHGTGSMVWPCSGTVVSGFGWRIHPILGTRRFHTGIDIAAGYGSPIVAADSGVVIYATWNGGYGNCTAVDHGRGVSTLYAHQSRMVVGYGTRVSKGQVIGYVGSTGLSTGPHLHFEVRVNGSPVDPMGYLR